MYSKGTQIRSCLATFCLVLAACSIAPESANEARDAALVDNDEEDTIGNEGYFFVRIQAGPEDVIGDNSSKDPGPDIDYVGVLKNGDLLDPFSVVLESDMSKYPHYMPRDAEKAGLRIDAFSSDDLTTINCFSSCDTASANVVSVGLSDEPGAIWGFTEPIIEGDTIVVVERGCCSVDARRSYSEPYTVSIAKTIDAAWVRVGERLSEAPLLQLQVPSLP